MTEFNLTLNDRYIEEIGVLNKSFLESKESLNLLTNLEERYAKLWELKEISMKIKRKYSYLNKSTNNNYREQYINWLLEEIVYFEKCLKMKIKHVGILRIDFRHLIECAILEYEYFIELGNDCPEELIEFIGDSIEINLPPHLTLLHTKLYDSVLCVISGMQSIEAENYSMFYIEYELLGNLYLQLFNFLIIYVSESSDYRQNCLRLCYHYYLKSIHYLDILNRQSPQTYYEGVDRSGVSFSSLYYDFFQESATTVNNVRDKVDYLLSRNRNLEENNIFENFDLNLEEANKNLSDNNYKEAFLGYNHILGLRPLFLNVRVKKCATLFKLNRIDDAEKCIKRLIWINPIEWSLLKQVLDLLINNGREDLAFKYIELYSKKDSEDIEYLKDLGQFYFRLDKHMEAEAFYEKILNISDKDIEVITALSQCKINTGEFDMAMELAQKGKNIKSDDSNLIALLSELERIIEIQKIIKDLCVVYSEIQFDTLIEKTKIDQPLLINILESMIKKKEINAKIRSNSLVFIKKEKAEESIQVQPKDVFIGRGGSWEVNRFHYKIKIKNNSNNVITNIRVLLDKFPEMLKLEGQELLRNTVLEPEGGLWTPEFILNAGEECVSGKIFSNVRFFDSLGKSTDYNVDPLEISYICPLLEAKNLEEIEYLRRIKKMNRLEETIQISIANEIPDLLKEISAKMEQMNLAIVKHEDNINGIYGYAEDKINHDGLALESEIKSAINGQTEIIVKAICEKDDKCASLLHKAIKEISNIGLSLEKSIIIDKLNMFIDKPKDLHNYIKKILKAKWSDDKKNLWADTVQEILEEWKSLRQKKWIRICKSILKFTVSTIASEKLGHLITTGFEKLFEWVGTNLEGVLNNG